MPAYGIDDELLHGLRALFAGLPSFRFELRECRHFPAVLGDERPSQVLESPRLVAVEAGGQHQLLEFRDRDLGVFAGRGAAAEQGRRGQVHPLVGALGRKDRGDQQLERVLEVEGAAAVRVLPPEPGEDLVRPGAFGLSRLAPRLRRSDPSRHLLVRGKGLQNPVEKRDH